MILIYLKIILFRITVRNSNYKNIQVFQDKDTIFNYEGRSGTKQGVYIISRGLLGDAMKQLLSLGYVLVHLNDDGTQLTNKQWEYPLTICHNGEEWKSIPWHLFFLHLDHAVLVFYQVPYNQYGSGTLENTLYIPISLLILRQISL
jgi:hypothetical protein